MVDDGNGPRSLAPVEIVADGPYDFDARYNPGRVEYFAPARLDSEHLERVRTWGVHVHETLGLGHLSRSDMILDDAGQLWFIEVNVAPGMTETSLLPQAARADGLNLPQLYRALVEAALADPDLRRGSAPSRQ